MLSLTTLNPTCKIKYTTKRYYNQYLYKAVIYLPAGRIIQTKGNLSFDSILYIRRKHNLSLPSAFRINSDAWSLRTKSLPDAKTEQLTYWHNVVNSHSDKIKYRIEEPWMQIYTNDQHLLYDLVKHDAENVTEIYIPENQQAIAALESNQIIVKKHNGYDYKIYLKEGYTLDKETRHNIGQYLANLGDEVKLTKSMVNNFNNRRIWFTGGYFYAKNDSVTTFLNLISPGIISGIFKLTCLEQ